MFAAVDLGSNSFRLHVGMHDGETIRIVKTARDPVRLGAGFDAQGNLTAEAMRSALASLAHFRELLAAFTLDGVRVVATNALRSARNAHEFLPLAEQAIGHPIEIISGEEEGRLIYMGLASALAAPAERRLVIDIGGGSTELVLGRGETVDRVESFSIGTVKQSLLFFPDGRIDAGSFDAAILSARSYFEDGASSFHPRYWKAAYGSSGTIRTISELIESNLSRTDTLSRSALEALKAHLVEAGSLKRLRLAGARPERMPAVLGGLAVLLALMEEIGIEEIAPVDAGLRMGVLRDLQLRASQADRREQSVREFMRRFHADQNRAQRAAVLAGTLLERLKPESESYANYLRWSALLHEIGQSVSHTGYHKHAAYMILHADLPGFTEREQRIISTLVLAQKGNLRKAGEALNQPDMAKAVLALRLAVLFMHSRTPIDADALGIRMKGRIELEVPRQWAQEHPSVACWLDKERDAWEEVEIDFAVRSGG
jgi:exopolyphosphatase/guanosine-5'-triphosphate,3'-diphosphate pyrophosphatase